MSSGPPGHVRARITLPLLLALVGCETGDDAIDDASSSSAQHSPASTTNPPMMEASFELGTGLTRWQALAEGDSIELVAGPQGGWHVDVSVRGAGVEPEGLRLDYYARDAEDGAELSYVTSSQLIEGSVLPADEGWLRLGDRVVFDIDGPEEVVGADICLIVEISGADWQAEDQRCVTVVDALP